MADNYKLDPLQHQVPIVNPDGTPSNDFIRKWQQQVLGSSTSSAAIAAAVAAVDAVLATTIGGDGTIITPAPAALGDGNIELTLADTAVTPGTYGDATNSPQITVDQQGRITDVVDVPISGGGGGGGTYFSPLAGTSLALFPTAVTNGTASGSAADDAVRGLCIAVNSGGNDDFYMRMKSAARPGSGTTAFICRLIFDAAATGASTHYPGAYIMLRNSTNGRALALGFDGSVPGGLAYSLQTWVNDSFGSTLGSFQGYMQDCWFKFEVDSSGAVRAYRSQDGYYWISVATTTLAAYLEASGGTFDQVGFGCKYHTGAVHLTIPFYSDDGSIS